MTPLHAPVSTPGPELHQKTIGGPEGTMGTEQGLPRSQEELRESEPKGDPREGHFVGEEPGEDCGTVEQEEQTKGELQAEDDGEEKTMMRILRGDFTNLPPAKTNIIRIFLSSTFSGESMPYNKVRLSIVTTVEPFQITNYDLKQSHIQCISYF